MYTSVYITAIFTSQTDWKVSSLVGMINFVYLSAKRLPGDFILEMSDSDLLGANIQLLEHELPSVIPFPQENSHCESSK